MNDINLNDKFFVGVENYDDGDLTTDTIFHYHQEDNCVWGTYKGGGVLMGTLVAKIRKDNSLKMVWQYLSHKGEFVSGICNSTPDILPDGRIRFHESWTTHTPNPVSGNSIIEEIKL